MTYEELCIAVGKIDKEAEEYLRTDAKSLSSFLSNDNDSIDDIFTLDETPQGQKYWENIYKKLKTA